MFLVTFLVLNTADNPRQLDNNVFQASSIAPVSYTHLAMCMMLVMLPFFMLAMYEKHGQPLEKIVGNIIKVAVIRPKERPYQTNNFYAVLERQEKLDKEVYDIVHGNQKLAAPAVRKRRKDRAAG